MKSFTNINTTINTRNFESEQWFLDNIRKPAQAFLASEEGHAFVRAHFGDEFADTLYERMDEPLCRLYLIRYKGIPLYRGESVKPYARLGDHIFHMHEDSRSYFGLEEHELPFVTFEVGSLSYSDLSERRAAEMAAIMSDLPILQGRNHLCILRKDRYYEVHKWYNDRDEIAKVIEKSVFGPGRYCIEWRDFVHGNPCLNWSEQELDETLTVRIGQFVDALSREDRRKLLHQLAQNLGGSGYVTTRMAKIILARLFDGNETLDDFFKMMQLSSDIISENLKVTVTE